MFFRNLSLKSKFTFIMIIVGFIANVTVAVGAFYFIQHFKEKTLMHEAKMILYSEKASRDYTSQTLRPAVLGATPKFVMQAESATFVSLGIAKILNKFMPDYVYSEPTLNPLNLKNKADKFQSEIIQKFKTDPSIKSINGFHNFKGHSYFYVMEPVVVRSGCMLCHGNPQDAPKAIVAKYGSTHGFHWKIGHIVGALSVIIPTRDINRTALKNAILIAVAIFVLPFIALIIALFFINKFIIKPIHEMTKLAEDVSTGKSNEDFKVKSNDEIGALAKSFNRLKKSYIKAVEMLADKNRKE